MQNFRYQSLTTSGESRDGLLTAIDRADAVRKLTGRGETAVSIEPEGARGAKPRRNGVASKPAHPVTRPKEGYAFSLRRRGRPTIRRPEMANFIRELATALEAGLPLTAMPVTRPSMVLPATVGDAQILIDSPTGEPSCGTAHWSPSGVAWMNRLSRTMASPSISIPAQRRLSSIVGVDPSSTRIRPPRPNWSWAQARVRT